MGIKPRFKVVLVLFVLANGATCENSLDTNETGTQDRELGKRTIMVSKFLLVPTLAAIGLKFLLLMPLFLSKIALLSLLNFISANLNLLINALMSFKQFTKKEKPPVWPANVDQPQLEYEYWKPDYHVALSPYDTYRDSHSLSFYNQYPSDVYYAVPSTEELAAKSKPANDAQVPLNHRNVRDSEVQYDQPVSEAHNTGKYRCYWTEGGSSDRRKFSVLKPKNTLLIRQRETFRELMEEQASPDFVYLLNNLKEFLSEMLKAERHR